MISLECDSNQLRRLDITYNKKLAYLNCADNAIRQLNTNNNKSLEHLFCERNQLLAGNINLSRKQFNLCTLLTSPQEATIKIKNIGGYYYIPLPNIADTKAISNLSYGELTSKGILVNKSTLPKTITYSYNIFTDGKEMTKVTIHTKK